jgi:glycerol-3-phosphate dehydrogenase
MHARPDLGEPVSDGSPTLRVEIVYVIRAEMAVRLTDIVVRRTGLGGSGHPGRAAIEACATVAASELGWDDARVADEIAAVEATYA